MEFEWRNTGILLKINPAEVQGSPLALRETLSMDARLKGSALFKWGQNGGESHDEVDEVVRCGACCGDGGAPGGGSGSKERAAEAGAEPVPGGVGAMERNREEAGCD